MGIIIKGRDGEGDRVFGESLERHLHLNGNVYD